MSENDKSNRLRLEAIIIDLIVASIIVFMIIFCITILFGKQIESAIGVLNMVSIDTNKAILSEIKFDKEKNQMIEYPEYGSRYGNIKLDSIGVNLPLYFGDKLEILRNGVGHSSGSYFPGEGGTIICMGHNTKAFLHDLPMIKIGEEIDITTTYGEYKYKVYEKKVVNMYDTDQTPIQREEEILMLYTCYPIDGLGTKTDRYIVYAKRI